MTYIQGLADRISERMQILGYWRTDRPDVRRFCEERGYTPQYLYGWLRGRMPSFPYLNRLALDLGVTVEWLALGGSVVDGESPLRRERMAGGVPEPGRRVDGPRDGERGRPDRGKVIEHPLSRVGVLVERLARSEADLQSTISAWRDSEARFRKIFEDGPLGMAIVDPQFLHFLGVNRRLAEMLGCPAEEIAGRHVLDFTHPDEVDAAAAVLARVQSGELPFATRETRYLRRAAGVIWGHVTSMIIRNDAGVPLYGVEMIQDVTERKSAEERLQSLFAGIPVGVYRSTPEGQMRDANPALLQILGCEDLETLRGLNASDFYVDPEERRRWEEALRRTDVVRDYEKQFRRRDGTVIWVRDSARAIRDGEDRLVAWEGALEDITSRKRAEEATKALARVSRDLAGTLDLARTSEQIVNAVLELLRVRRSTLFQLDRAAGRFVCVAAAGADDPRRWIGRTTPADGGLMGLAVRERAPQWSADVLADPRCGARSEVAGDGSELVVPLSAGGEALGVLGIGDALGRGYSDEEIGLLSALADRAALAFANARLYEETERRRREAEVLADLAGQTTASLDLGTVLKAVIAGAKILCRSDLARIALADAATGAMVFRYWDDPRFERYAGYRIEPGKGCGGRVLATGRPFRTDHYVEDPRITKDYVAIVRAEGIIAEMVVPIRIDGRIEGLLYVHHLSPREFSDGDEAILLRLADQAAIAIRNARLFAEAERRRKAAEGLADVSRLVSESLDPREVGQRIVESVLGLLDVQTAGLYQLDPVSARLQALAVAGDVGPKSEWNVVLAPGTGVVGLAVRECHAVFTANCFADPRIVYAPEVRARLQAIPYPTVLAVPLLVKGRVVGALGLGDRAGRRFEEEEVRLAEAFANQAAIALENARLFVQTEAQRDRLLRRPAEPAEVVSPQPDGGLPPLQSPRR